MDRSNPTKTALIIYKLLKIKQIIYKLSDKYCKSISHTAEKMELQKWNKMQKNEVIIISRVVWQLKFFLLTNNGNHSLNLDHLWIKKNIESKVVSVSQLFALAITHSRVMNLASPILYLWNKFVWRNTNTNLHFGNFLRWRRNTRCHELLFRDADVFQITA